MQSDERVPLIPETEFADEGIGVHAIAHAVQSVNHRVARERDSAGVDALAAIRGRVLEAEIFTTVVLGTTTVDTLRARR